MTEWLLCAAVVVAMVVLMPRAVRYSRRSRGMRSGGMAIGAALNGFYDPARKVATEEIERQREIGDSARETADGKPD